MARLTDRQKSTRELLHWIVFIPIGIALFAVGEFTGFLYNLIADALHLGLIGNILAYPAHLITACIGLYISFLIAMNKAPDKWLGSIILCCTFLVLFTVAIVLAATRVLSVNLFFYLEMAILMGMMVFTLIRVVPNKEELFE